MKKSKILLVDDEDRNLRLMEAMLAPLGHEVDFAQDGIQAIAKVQDNSPDLILLDVMMPRMDGFEALQGIKNNVNLSLIPIVMVTALRDVEARTRALELGADDFLSKPVERIELLARVKSLLKVKAYNDHMRRYQETLEADVEMKTCQLRKACEETKKASLETILHLSRAAEYKDEETGDHIQRVSQFAAELARKYGMDDEMVEIIMYASPMHDIGKIGIPEHILLKPGKLDPHEWETMKQHTIIGGHILEGSQVKYLHHAEIISLTHHERWDGKGYPLGLAGEAIPLEGRITALADVFDALTSDRPYRRALTVQEAFQIIREGQGTQFDPEIVEMFFSIKENILEIRSRYPDISPSPSLQINEKYGKNPKENQLGK